MGVMDETKHIWDPHDENNNNVYDGLYDENPEDDE